MRRYNKIKSIIDQTKYYDLLNKLLLKVNLMTIIVTGGAGFIGSNFIHEWFSNENEDLINIDCLTYAGNLENLKV